jgi:hypothetical protein
MNQYYDEIPLSSPKKLGRLDERGGISGDAWWAYPQDGLYILEFLEAAHAGRLRKLFISEDAYNDLKSERVTATDLSYRDRPDLERVDEEHREWINALNFEKPQKHIDLWNRIMLDTQSELLTLALWRCWGSDSLKMLDSPLPALNIHLRWWKYGQERRTLRKMIQTDRGREEAWGLLKVYPPK